MEAKEFKSLVLEVTLKCVDRRPEDWFTFNDKMNTHFVQDNYQPQNIRMDKDELPIIECDLDDSYFLITTDRIISINDGIFDSVNFFNMFDFCGTNEKLNYRNTNEELPKVDTLCIKKVDGGKLIAKIDSHYPAFFTKILIYNILVYKKEGRWYLNPGKRDYK
ncbi:hypothetical protein J2787_003898 [Chryseobacterium rhizosphaerae]|uniref:Uncharacterized protein n=1 Tax=Chryseobacterium rhizosphaerae TaxID=395937 RepID=A0AAE3YEA0_9FLAO|nr:hypothetical protein [Chryseobacterium rhizosphaerae]MDR6528461.1 hypothetical protein [Chryseobacterium rhizosphaerae]